MLSIRKGSLMFGRRKKHLGPKSRYAIVVSLKGSGEPELAADAIPAAGADMAVATGVIYSSPDDARAHLRNNELPTRDNPAADGTWYAIRDVETQVILDG
ncbi:MAG: hypothetical protein MO852_11995 [Candidatus Devosia euplotis]|nr:hypothetical protein [Candidatus Devosia euplotis]